MSKYDLHKMMGLDLYLSSFNTEEYEKVIGNLNPSLKARTPLISWDFYVQAYHKKLEKFGKVNDRVILNRLKTKYSWTYNFDVIDWKNANYQTIVITDTNTKIIHVSSGFVSMTGYKMEEAIGRSPKFLQGANTSPKTRAVIRHAIAKGKPIITSLTNYRKNGEEYICEVDIRPLFNINKEMTHFIALEREVA